MKRVQFVFLVLGVFFTAGADAAVLWQRTLQVRGTGNFQLNAEQSARTQLNMQISSSQSQCNQGIGLIFAFYKGCRKPLFIWECDYRVTFSCEN